ncbi:MAG: O-antigen ligase family protein [Candidatus Komeilibacteria bacterium]|nr:O-antigen ligase family protein [Candidatus Komeilibacteria bacterium]
MISPVWLPVWCVIGLLFLFACIIYSRPRWGIYAIAATLPSYLIRFTIFEIPTTVLEVSILILFFTWLANNGRWKKINLRFWQRNTANPILSILKLPLTLLLATAFIAALLSPSQAAAFGILKAYFIDPMLFFVVFVYEIKNEKHIERVFYALGILAVSIGCAAAWQYATGIGIANPTWADPAYRRVTTIFGYPNAHGLLLGPIVALYMGYLFRKSDRRMLAWKIIVIALGLTAIIAAKTTGALVGIGAALWIFGSLQKKYRTTLLALTLLIVLGLTFTPAPERFSNVLSRISDNTLDLASSSLEIRANQWRETLAMLSDHPIRGGGLANYRQALEPYHAYEFLEIYLYPHTLILNFWSEIGIAGLLAIGWLLVSVGRLLLAANRSQQSSWLSASLILAWSVVLVHGLVDVPYFKNDLSVLWMLLVGLTVAATNNRVQALPHTSDDAYHA